MLQNTFYWFRNTKTEEFKAIFCTIFWEAVYSFFIQFLFFKAPEQFFFWCSTCTCMQLCADIGDRKLEWCMLIYERFSALKQQINDTITWVSNLSKQCPVPQLFYLTLVVTLLYLAAEDFLEYLLPLHHQTEVLTTMKIDIYNYVLGNIEANKVKPCVTCALPTYWTNSETSKLT